MKFSARSKRFNFGAVRRVDSGGGGDAAARARGARVRVVEHVRACVRAGEASHASRCDRKHGRDLRGAIPINDKAISLPPFIKFIPVTLVQFWVALSQFTAVVHFSCFCDCAFENRA